MSEAEIDREGRGGRRKRVPRPLDEPALNELALAYVARFATSRAKLIAYVRRKLRECGWAGDNEPDLDALGARIADLGFLDDQAYAAMKAASLTRRGYGKGRIRTALQASGIAEADGAEALATAEEESLAAALRFAERRRLGPYAERPLEGPAREKAIAAMIRAGHPFGLARRIIATTPGELQDLMTEIDQSR